MSITLHYQPTCTECVLPLDFPVVEEAEDGCAYCAYCGQRLGRFARLIVPDQVVGIYKSLKERCFFGVVRCGQTPDGWQWIDLENRANSALRCRLDWRLEKRSNEQNPLGANALNANQYLGLLADLPSGRVLAPAFRAFAWNGFFAIETCNDGSRFRFRLVSEITNEALRYSRRLTPGEQPVGPLPTDYLIIRAELTCKVG